MENDSSLRVSVSEFIAAVNQTLDFAYPSIEIEGEVNSFKVNQGKYVFFDLKDEASTVGCFMSLFSLRIPVEDGMKVVVSAVPKLTPWGKFSLTVRAIRPVGKGSLKKSFELLRAKLDKEGLFSPDRKRRLPQTPRHVAVISSTQAAGYADFIKILNDRWGGIDIEVAHVQVQGVGAADQMIKALRFFNAKEIPPEVVVIIRGGGSADDLSVFNDEPLVREIALSRVPTLVGVGHEVDVSLADMVADVRAATPSNAAQILVPDCKEFLRNIRRDIESLLPRMEREIESRLSENKESLTQILTQVELQIERKTDQLASSRAMLGEMNPQKVLERGYALVRGKPTVGRTIEIEKSDILITAEVKNVSQK